jgi:hypothetical protein
MRFAAALLAMGAGPAAASPIFTAASLTPDTISPNGDFVQDAVVVSYTIEADSAQVIVSLTPDGGGSTVAVMQPLTKQGQGEHTVLFDGIVGGEPVPDGDYDVVVFGVGNLGEGEETRTLDLTVDATPPTILSLDVVQPADGVAENGDAVVIDVCVGGSPGQVTADFSLLDTGFDPDSVAIDALDPACYRITYLISEDNDRIDAAGIAVAIEAVDAGGNRVATQAELCLSNAPPTVTSVTLLNEFSIFQNGDRIEAEIAFSSPALVLSVGGDFSNLDSGFRSDQVAVQALGNKRFRISYTISAANTQPDGDYRVELFAMDPGCGTALDSSLVVSLDNAGDFAAVISDVILEYPAFSPRQKDGVQDDVEIFFIALEDTVLVSIDARMVVEGNPNIQQIRVLNRTPYTMGPGSYVWDGNTEVGIEVDDIPDQTIELIVFGTSTDADRRRNARLLLEFDNQDPVVETFRAPTGAVRNGDLIELSIHYDSPGLTLRPDFSRLDSGFSPTSPNLAVVDSLDGTYGIFYLVSAGNTRSDSAGVVVPVRATDPAGNEALSELVQLCLSNHPPELVDADLVSGPGPYRNTTTVTLEVEFEGAQPPLTVTGDFSAVDTEFEPGDADGVDILDGRRFSISYRISSSNSRVDAASLPITVTATDRGCGTTTVVPFRITLDNISAERPVLDPQPGVVRDPVLQLGGSAPGAIQVEIRTGITPIDTFLVAEGRFSEAVQLVPGGNTFAAVALDEAGNRSTPSVPVEVFYVESAFADLPKRFAPGDEFFIGLAEPAVSVLVHIFNLEGVEIQRLDGGSGDLFTIPWDGIDNRGSLSSSGPYIAVIEIVPGGGRPVERLRKAFVFTRRGVEP